MPKFLRHLDLHLIVVTTSKKAAAAEFEHDTNARVGGEENTSILFLGKTSEIAATRYDIQ